ncbi:MAG TPA: helix-turn-helix transcriptional regulator [Azospirillum sp.]
MSETIVGNTHLARRRVALGLTQKRVAAMLDTDQPTVSRAEQGRPGQDAVAQRLTELYAALERERNEVARVKADTFWSKAQRLPGADSILPRLEQVAGELLDGSLNDVALGETILDCLPAASRRKATDRQAA